jgi:hypothetical protein
MQHTTFFNEGWLSARAFRRDPLLSGRPAAFFRQLKRAPPLFLCSLLREPHLHSWLLWVCDEEEEAYRN